MSLQLKILIISFFVFLPVCYAEDAYERGETEASETFQKEGPKVASFGGIGCIMGYGLSDLEQKRMEHLKNGPSYCGCDEEDINAKSAFVTGYNRKMLQLIQETKKLKK